MCSWRHFRLGAAQLPAPATVKPPSPAGTLPPGSGAGRDAEREQGVLAEQRAGGFLGAAGNICPAIAVAHHASFHELQIFT